jgi:hypothetical protein
MDIKLPYYIAEITDDIEGISAISLVDSPAVESDFLKFSKDKIKLNFKIENEEKRLVTGVVMRCDYPIYRIGVSGYEYYIIFNKETIIKMTEKMLKDNTFNNINLEHNDKRFVEGVNLRELFIKDTDKGINPKGFEDITNGSLFATYHVTNDEIWDEIKNGTFNGFSLEGLFTVNEQKPQDIYNINNYDELEDILNNLIK